MKSKYLILIVPLIGLLIFDYWFIFIKKDKKIEPLVDNEPICKENCKEGDKVVLKDGSSWHILNIVENKITLFSDATIDLEGNYLPVNTFSTENTGVPIAFDVQNERLTEDNPYCIFPDIGCSAYEKNNIDVFEDSTIKKVIDSKFVPKITQTLNTTNITIRLLKKEEFEHFKTLENQTGTNCKWLYYSGYWLMTPHNQYGVLVHKENTYVLSIKSAYIHHSYGIRPVIEADKQYIF